MNTHLSRFHRIGKLSVEVVKGTHAAPPAEVEAEVADKQEVDEETKVRRRMELVLPKRPPIERINPKPYEDDAQGAEEEDAKKGKQKRKGDTDEEDAEED